MMRGNTKPWAVAGIRVDASYNSPGCVWPAPAIYAPTVAGTAPQRSAHLQSGVLYGREQQFESDKNNELVAGTFMKWQRLARCDRLEAHT